jgi:hypothetical protein
MQKGESNMLTRLLRKRFGELPASVCARIQSATSEQLEEWAERLMEVTTLNELFGADAAS